MTPLPLVTFLYAVSALSLFIVSSMAQANLTSSSSASTGVYPIPTLAGVPYAVSSIALYWVNFTNPYSGHFMSASSIATNAANDWFLLPSPYVSHDLPSPPLMFLASPSDVVTSRYGSRALNISGTVNCSSGRTAFPSIPGPVVPSMIAVDDVGGVWWAQTVQRNSSYKSGYAIIAPGYIVRMTRDSRWLSVINDNITQYITNMAVSRDGTRLLVFAININTASCPCNTTLAAVVLYDANGTAIANITAPITFGDGPELTGGMAFDHTTGHILISYGGGVDEYDSNLRYLSTLRTADKSPILAASIAVFDNGDLALNDFSLIDPSYMPQLAGVRLYQRTTGATVTFGTLGYQGHQATDLVVNGLTVTVASTGLVQFVPQYLSSSSASPRTINSEARSLRVGVWPLLVTLALTLLSHACASLS